MKKYLIAFLVFYWAFMIIAPMQANADIIVEHRNAKGKIAIVEILGGVSVTNKTKEQLKDIAYNHCTDGGHFVLPRYHGTLVLIKYNNEIFYAAKCKIGEI